MPPTRPSRAAISAGGLSTSRAAKSCTRLPLSVTASSLDPESEGKRRGYHKLKVALTEVKARATQVDASLLSQFHAVKRIFAEKLQNSSMSLRCTFAGVEHAVPVDLDQGTVGDLKAAIEGITGCPRNAQKLMFKGLLAAPDKPELDVVLLRDTALKNGAKVLVVGATAAQQLAVEQTEKAVKAAGGPGAALEAATSTSKKSDVWAAQPEHMKVLSKGKPEDAAFAYRPGQDPLPEEPLTGLCTKTGKVRLTFRDSEQTLVISTKENTQSVPFRGIKSVSSQPIPGHEEYHILALRTGTTDKSDFFVYWVPAQYISAIKGTILSGGMFL